MREQITVKRVEIVVCLLFIALAGRVIWEGVRLGPAWGETGPQPGFFPFALALVLLAGALGALISAARQRDSEPFFAAPEEWIDLLKVGIPSGIAIGLISWLGLYITSGLYVAFFVAWYGRYPWYLWLLAGVVVPVVLYALLRYGFNISMPMSPWYRQGILPV